MVGEGITGTLLRHAQFPSRHVAARNVDVWLPPGYDAAKDTRYPVLYMHDGQMLFDPATTWNRQAWEVDAAAAIQDVVAGAAVDGVGAHGVGLE